ncbi:MAG TPA: hypothetical protein VIN59_02370 [Alphaproteobacteria bacterium]
MNFDAILAPLFDRTLAYPMATAGLRFKTYGAAVVLSPEVLRHGLQIAGRLSRVFNAKADIGHLITLTEHIDDMVDAAYPAEILQAGATGLGDIPSPFLFNEKFVDPIYFSTLQRLHFGGIVPGHVSVNFSNLFADLCREKADMQMRYADGDDHVTRIDIAKNNLELSGVFTTFFYSFLSPSQKLIDQKTPITKHDVAAAYPQMYRLNYTMQYIDDLRDIMIDLADEVRTGCPTSNIVLAYGMPHNTARHIVMKSWSEKLSKMDNVRISDLPIVLQSGIKAAGIQAMQEIGSLEGVMTRGILGSFWRNTLREGFMTPNHQTYQENLTHNQTKYLALKASLV